MAWRQSLSLCGDLERLALAVEPAVAPGSLRQRTSWSIASLDLCGFVVGIL
jgi:hypothetical protein